MSLSTHHLLNLYVARRLKYPRDLGLEQKAVGDANDDDRNGPRTSPLISVDNGGRTRSLGPLRRETTLVREPAAPLAIVWHLLCSNFSARVAAAWRKKFTTKGGRPTRLFRDRRGAKKEHTY